MWVFALIMLCQALPIFCYFILASSDGGPDRFSLDSPVINASYCNHMWMHPSSIQ